MAEKLRVLDLFSGIGGFSLGLERAGGFRTVAFCEIDPFARAVLAHHWPGVPQYDDVRTLTAERLAADGISVDVICGGFPCQDISYAGRGAGLGGEQSGLWWEFYRLIKEIRPQYAIIENVDALRRRGLGAMLRALAGIGYDAEWYRISAADVGAPHRRNRIWIIAYPAIMQREAIKRGESDGACDVLAYPNQQSQPSVTEHEEVAGVGGGMGDTAGARRECRTGEAIGCEQPAEFMRPSESLADTYKPRLEERPQPAERLRTLRQERDAAFARSYWADGIVENGRIVKSGVRVLAHGVPHRVAQLRCLGNAVVPAIPEAIGRAILEAEGLTP